MCRRFLTCLRPVWDETAKTAHTRPIWRPSGLLTPYFTTMPAPPTLLPCSAVELPEDLKAIVDGAGGFAMGYPATTKDGISYSLQNDVPYQLRLATALFTALGRSPNDKFGVVKSGQGHYEFTPDEPEPLGLRCVTLSTPLAKLTEPIMWSAASAEKYLGQWYGEPVIKECLAKTQVFFPLVPWHCDPALVCRTVVAF